MSRGYTFLRTRRWLGIAVLTVVIAAICVTLGFWQLSRHEYRAEAIARVETNSTQAPVPLTDLLPATTTEVGDDLEWRAVTVTGRYVGAPVVLPQRGVERGPADHALAVLAVEGPEAEKWLLVVDRGSYPTDAFRDPADRLELPSGEIDLVLRLRPAEAASTRDPVSGQVFVIDPGQVLDAAAPDGVSGTLVSNSYAWVVSESPTTANPPTPIPVPSPNYRSNLSYAMQWWTFGLLAFVGFGVMARRERAALDREAGVPGAARRRRRRRTDADVEDAEIDAAQAAQASDTSSV
ncbi:SURF1 family protein [Pseudactinotalea suaedae]|uniref:SURF1 family protein n=1 Tax=Pseudactinotalea suaedae TaxID=1524924 RepID=UPI0012E2C982|nr:SURF1 family protein [Pseudactinotalea suaedae]